MEEQYAGRGSGRDGFVTLTSHNPIDSQCSGAVDSKLLNANNAQFAAGRFIKIRQERGTNYGKQEINKILSYDSVNHVITTVNKLKYNYSSSGANRAQVIVMPEYSGVVIEAGFSVKPWNDFVGAHFTFLCTGRVINNSGVTIDGIGRGFRGGDREASGAPPSNAEQGDSPTGAPARSNSANGPGGGGAGDRNTGEGDHGGPAANATQPTSNGVVGGDITGDPGIIIDSLNLLDRFIMGPGGGGGVGPGGNDIGGFGGPGGATFDIYCFEFINNGLWNFSGKDGNTASFYGNYNDGEGNPSTNPVPGGSQGCGGGGGAAGDGRVTCNRFINTNTGSILLNGGQGGLSNNPSKGRAGNGTIGVLGVRCCSYLNEGTISAYLTVNEGGHSWCAVPGGMI